MSETNAKRYWIAIPLLRELRKAAPDYETEQTEIVLASAIRNSHMQHADTIWESANSAFEEDQWTVAMIDYQEYADYILDKGLGHDLAGEAIYNKAMAQHNDSRDRDAVNSLLWVRENAPDYQPRLVQEQLQKFRRSASLRP